MAVVFTKAFYTPNGGSETEISNWFRIDTQRGLDMKSSRLTFDVPNSMYRDKVGGASIFSEGALFEFYADYSPISRTEEQLLLSGQVREIDFKGGESGSTVTVSFADRTTLLLGSLWAKDYTNMTPDAIIRSVVAWAGNGEITTAGVATSTVSGGAFPTIEQFGYNMKPVYDWISELSQTGYTGEDRTMIFFVDKNNDLHWFYPEQTVSSTLTEGTDDIYSYSLKRNSDAVTNMVIFNAGQDLNGNGTLWYHFDTGSKSNELKMKYQPMTDISRELYKQEILAGNLVEDAAGTAPYQGKLYTVGTSGTTTWGEAFASASAYRTAFRNRLKYLGVERSKIITTQFGKLLWNGNIVVKGNNTYTAGQLLSITIPSAGIINHYLRIQDVTHSFSNNGWTTSLQVKEDEQAITANVGA